MDKITGILHWNPFTEKSQWNTELNIMFMVSDTLFLHSTEEKL